MIPTNADQLIDSTIAKIAALRDVMLEFLQTGVSDEVLHKADQKAHDLVLWAGKISTFYGEASTAIAQVKNAGVSDGARGMLTPQLEQKVTASQLMPYYRALSAALPQETSPNEGYQET